METGIFMCETNRALIDESFTDKSNKAAVSGSGAHGRYRRRTDVFMLPLKPADIGTSSSKNIEVY
jgi:hypothetical protein